MKPAVVFVCTGNICRSPVAEVIAREMFGVTGLEFASAGLDAAAGLPASRESQRFVAARGLSLAGHGSRPLSRDVLASAVWLIGMTRSHVVLTRRLLRGSYHGRIGLLGAPGVDLAGDVPTPEAPEVADPYGGAREDYEAMGMHVAHLLEGWADEFRRLAAERNPAS